MFIWKKIMSLPCSTEKCASMGWVSASQDAGGECCQKSGARETSWEHVWLLITDAHLRLIRKTIWHKKRDRNRYGGWSQFEAKSLISIIWKLLCEKFSKNWTKNYWEGLQRSRSGKYLHSLWLDTQTWRGIRPVCSNTETLYRPALWGLQQSCIHIKCWWNAFFIFQK